VTRTEQIAHNLQAVRARIQRAEVAAGRASGSVRLIAVSKTMPAEDIQAAMAADQRDFGENYGQELRDKRQALASQAPRWHFIGPLQSNKVKYVAGQAELIHTLDTPALLIEVGRRLETMPSRQPQECLVQVNVAAEPQKRGVLPRDLPALLDSFAGLPSLRCVGLMLIPPLSDDPEQTRPHFAAVRNLRDEQAARTRPGVALTELSMGMSDDLEVAIAEGATLVRVGTAIFGERRKP
jgi:PLP dependent protein